MAWSEAAWTVNQIKKELNSGYDQQINNLASTYAVFVAEQNKKYSNVFSTSAMELIADNNYSQGTLCFIYQ